MLVEAVVDDDLVEEVIVDDELEDATVPEVDDTVLEEATLEELDEEELITTEPGGETCTATATVEPALERLDTVRR